MSLSLRHFRLFAIFFLTFIFVFTLSSILSAGGNPLWESEEPEVLQPATESKAEPVIEVIYIKEKLTVDEMVEVILNNDYLVYKLPEHENPVPVYPYTEEELLILSNLIYFEVGNEPIEVKKKFSSIVLNRVFDEGDDCPNDLLGVIYQNKPCVQFTTAYTKDLKSIIEDIERDGIGKITQECIEVAREILTYGSVLPPEVMVFYGENDKGWVRTRTVYEHISKSYFAYLRY